MLVEHSFVTTLDAQAALAAADALLWALGFQREASSGDTVLEYRRGLAKAARAKKVSDLPQRVRLEYDRGRITLGASIEVFRKSTPLHRDVLLALAEAVECVVARGSTPEEARARWDGVHAHIEERAAARRRRDRIILVIVCVVLAFLVTVIVWLAASL